MPDEMNAIVKLILNSGVSITVIAYFMFRDYKFMSTLNNALTSLINSVDTLKEIIKSKGGDL